MKLSFYFKILILFLITIFVWYFVIFAGNDLKEIYFLNVGQGDSQFIRLGGVNILVDAGRDDKVVVELGKILPFYDKKIDILFITHPEEDHAQGVFNLLNKYNVGFAILNGEKEKLYFPLVSAFEKNKISYSNLGRGDEVSYASSTIDVLWPNNLKEETKKVTNESSLVLKIDLGDFKALLTGDIPDKIENVLLSDGDLQADVLKVAHHGSKYSSSESFLKEVDPKLSVIEVGKNSYGHPTKEALERLKDVSSNILRTDMDGTIRVGFEEGKLRVWKIKN